MAKRTMDPNAYIIIAPIKRPDRTLTLVKGIRVREY
jgi:hypothetical protein